MCQNRPPRSRLVLPWPDRTLLYSLIICLPFKFRTIVSRRSGRGLEGSHLPESSETCFVSEFSIGVSRYAELDGWWRGWWHYGEPAPVRAIKHDVSFEQHSTRSPLAHSTSCLRSSGFNCHVGSSMEAHASLQWRQHGRFLWTICARHLPCLRERRVCWIDTACPLHWQCGLSEFSFALNGR